MLGRREAVERVGGFDARFFMYCEDIDLCYRIRSAGWSVYYLPDATVGHFRGQSSDRLKERGEGALSRWGARQYTRSMIRFYQQHRGGASTLLLRSILVLTSIIKAAGWLTVGAVTRGASEGWSRARSYASMVAPALSRPSRRAGGR